MKYKFIIVLFLFFSVFLKAQTTFKGIVKDSITHEVLFGVAASIENTGNGASSDEAGLIVINTIADGKQRIVFYLIGYKKLVKSFDFPLSSTIPVVIYLAPEQTDLEEVVVTSTRTNSHIEDLPVKVEVLGQEDMDEESTIVPGNVSSILGDLSIITIQHTSQTNGNDAIRMQGLDAKYTQIMRDGLPLYDGFSGSLGVLSIPPLDLKQVEIIKGSASTLYGGGAIGGLINFISKTPSDSTQTTITLNGTSLGEGNMNTFISGKKNKIGATLFAGANIKQAADINDDGFTEVPSNQNYSIHPRLFLDLNPKTKFIIGLSSSYNNIIGGDMHAVKYGTDTAHPLLQKELTYRNTLDITYTRQFLKPHILTVKMAGSSFQRNLNYSGFLFNGTQFSNYTEVNDAIKSNKHTLVLGLNFITEIFKLGKTEAMFFKGYRNYTTGCFIQDDWQAFKKISFQLGLRYDHQNRFGDFVLPRISLFYHPKQKLSFRLAAGSGYKTPNMFDLTEPDYAMKNIPDSIKSENSYGINADISYHTVLFGELNFQIDEAIYCTNIQHPVVLQTNVPGDLVAANGKFEVNSYGSDTYIRLRYDELELYLGYNHTESFQQYNTFYYNMPFNPKDKFSTTLAYEIEGKWRAGFEAAYNANQYIYNNKKVNDFWFLAAMLEWKFKRGSMVLNCENLLDMRQSKFEPIVEGTTQSPVFKPVWTSLEGRVLNLSVKFKI